MIYFTLPSSPKNTYNHIEVDIRPQLPNVFLSQSLCNYMNDIKEKISSREKEWDVYKKYTNPYEYIHSIIPQKKRSVSKYKPISRSYFKMLEMIHTFGIDKPASTKSSSIDLSREKIQTFHLAEGPGGFIEAICNKRNNPEDDYYGMTIIYDETDDNVPAWHKTGYFLSHHPNVNLEYGIDKTGNLLHIENFEYCVEKYGGKMDLVTADGGFDFSKDFNRQEISIFNLLWGQVCYALCLQKLGGNFVLKIFDIFYEQTVHILYLLASFYDEVHVCKLKTSRIGNSEKYIVCKKFRFSSCASFYPIIHESFSKIKRSSTSSDFFAEDKLRCINTQREECELTPIILADSVVLADLDKYGQTTEFFAKEPHFYKSDEYYTWYLLNCEIPRYFTKQIEDINVIFGQQQIENIHYTISLIDKQPKQDKLDQLVKQNITKCVNWCVEHCIPYNNLTTINIFEQGNQNTCVPFRTNSYTKLQNYNI